ncbi:MAG: hypothetical protein WC614_07640 [bacterium]
MLKSTSWEKRYDKQLKEYAGIEESYKKKLFSILGDIVKTLGGKVDGEQIFFGEFTFTKDKYVIGTGSKK